MLSSAVKFSRYQSCSVYNTIPLPIRMFYKYSVSNFLYGFNMVQDPWHVFLQATIVHQSQLDYFYCTGAQVNMHTRICTQTTPTLNFSKQFHYNGYNCSIKSLLDFNKI